MDGGEEKKKKKKKNLAMEEFEKEFGDAPDAAQSKPKKKKVVEESDDEAAGGEEDEDGDFDDVADIDEEELGENPFANSGGGRGDAEEPWLSSDRDYTYEEVRNRLTSTELIDTDTVFSSYSPVSSASYTHKTPRSHPLLRNDILSLHLRSTVTETKSPYSQILETSAGVCTVNQRMSSRSSSSRWVQRVVSTVAGALSSRASFNKSRLRTFCGDTLVRLFLAAPLCPLTDAQFQSNTSPVRLANPRIHY